MKKKAKKPLQRHKLEEIFEKHRKPVVQKPPTIKLCSNCESYKKEILALNKEIDEQNEQIVKLKAALRKRDDAIEKMSGIIKPYYEDRASIQ